MKNYRNDYNIITLRKMTPPIQKRKHPRYRKKKTEEEKKKLSSIVKVKCEQSFKERLYSLPLEIKVIIFRVAMVSHFLDIGEKEHPKIFKPTNDFLNPKIYNPRRDRLKEDYSIHSIYGTYEITHYKMDRYGNKLEMYYESRTSCKDRLLERSGNKNCYHLDKIEEVYSDFRVRFWPLCERKVSLPTQYDIKDIKLDHLLNDYLRISGDLRTREWTNKPGYYWYHEKCRCRKCDRVRMIGYQSLNTSEKEKYNHISWDDESKQWKPKSTAQLKYEKRLEKLS